MGYTHAAVGAAGATGLALAMNVIPPENFALATTAGVISPGNYVIAATAGVIGGVLMDIDVRDVRKNSGKITDASRTRWVMIGLIGIFLLSAYFCKFCKFNILQEIILSKNEALIGIGLLAVVLCIARMKKGHRTFSHSLLFVFLTAFAISFINTSMSVFYLVGSLLHIFIDLFNNPVPGPYEDWNKKHGIWLLYPIVKGKGIAFGVCKAGGIGNKVIYFVGVVAFIALSVFYCVLLNDVKSIIPIAAVVFYLLISLHFVRKTSEKELKAKAS